MKDFTINTEDQLRALGETIGLTEGGAPKTDDENSASAMEGSQTAKKSFGDIPVEPTQDAVNGIRFDFNMGLRVMFPKEGRKYHITFMDMDTGTILFSADAEPGTIVTSKKRYYVRFRIVIQDFETEEVVFEHEMDLKGKDVLIQMPDGAIGDTIAWFSYVERFQQKNKCRIHCSMPKRIADLLREQYPDIHFITKDETKALAPYATYYLGLFFKGDTDNQPIDFRLAGLHRTAGMILGLRTKEELQDIPPRLNLSARRTIKGKYAVIATKASSQAKMWNNPYGWDGVVRFLKDSGYRVLCIDRDAIFGSGITFNQMPWGVEDLTGDISLQERVNIIKDADFFVGLPSGLSWLAWCCRVPVVMISGFSLPNTEFYTPYRVINYNACVGCWDDIRENFDHFDFLWCPRHRNDERQFECTRLISSEQVIETIRKIPSFRSVKKTGKTKKMIFPQMQK